MVRVLVLCTESPDRIWGGRGTHAKYLYEAMKGLCEIHYVSLDPEWKEHWYTHSTPWEEPVYFEPYDGGIKNMLVNTMAMLKHCLKLHAEKPFDVIHAHEFDTVEVAFHLRDVLGIPVVTTFHLFQNEMLKVEGKRGADEDRYSLVLEDLGLMHSDRVILVSGAMRRFAASEMRIERDYDVILNGVDLSEFSSVAPWKPHDGPVKALYCGRIAYQKGIEPLIEAIEHSEGIEWAVMGKLAALEPAEAEAHPYCKKLRELHAAGKCRWVGHLEGAEKVAEFERCDCVVMPSICEPFGIVALEAMAAGRLLLHTGVDGLKEFCNPSNSIQIQSTAESIVGGVLSVKTCDYEKLISAATATAKESRHDWRNIAKQVAQIYNKVTHGNV